MEVKIVKDLSLTFEQMCYYSARNIFFYYYLLAKKKEKIIKFFTIIFFSDGNLVQVTTKEQILKEKLILIACTCIMAPWAIVGFFLEELSK